MWHLSSISIAPLCLIEQGGGSLSSVPESESMLSAGLAPELEFPDKLYVHSLRREVQTQGFASYQLLSKPTK